MNLFAIIPLFSNVMNGAFGSDRTVATSSDIESNFRTVKHHILRKQMVRADKFMRLHLNYLMSEMKLQRSHGNGNQTKGRFIQPLFFTGNYKIMFLFSDKKKAKKRSQSWDITDSPSPKVPKRRSNSLSSSHDCDRTSDNISFQQKLKYESIYDPVVVNFDRNSSSQANDNGNICSSLLES